MSPEKREAFLLAAYWDTVAETAEGYALEQAVQRRYFYLRVLGFKLADDEKET